MYVHIHTCKYTDINIHAHMSTLTHTGERGAQMRLTTDASTLCMCTRMHICGHSQLCIL